MNARKPKCHICKADHFAKHCPQKIAKQARREGKIYRPKQNKTGPGAPGNDTRSSSRGRAVESALTDLVHQVDALDDVIQELKEDAVPEPACVEYHDWPIVVYKKPFTLDPPGGYRWKTQEEIDDEKFSGLEYRFRHPNIRMSAAAPTIGIASIAAAALAARYVPLPVAAVVGTGVSVVSWIAVGVRNLLGRVSTYRYVKALPSPTHDVRPDVISTGKLKHNVRLAEFVACVPRCLFFWRSSRMTVSLELLSQLNVANNADYSTSPAVAWDKLRYSAKSFHSVNIDKGLTLDKDPVRRAVVQDTTMVAYAAHREMVDRTCHQDFPEAAPSLAEMSSPMVIELGKFLFPTLVVSSLMCVSLGLAQRIYSAEFPYRLVSDLLLKVLLAHIQTQLTH